MLFVYHLRKIGANRLRMTGLGDRAPFSPARLRPRPLLPPLPPEDIRETPKARFAAVDGSQLHHIHWRIDSGASWSCESRVVLRGGGGLSFGPRSAFATALFRPLGVLVALLGKWSPASRPAVLARMTAANGYSTIGTVRLSEYRNTISAMALLSNSSPYMQCCSTS